MAMDALEQLRKVGQGERGVEETVSYGVGHRYRIEILAALHEGPASQTELAKIIRKPVTTIGHHIEELLSDGSIEIARTETIRGNIGQHYYRVVELPEFSDEEIEEMSPEDRQTLAAVILQAAMAEALASLWAGKLNSDPRVMLSWNRINLDKQGREDFADELARSWERVKEIECESANRLAESGEQGVTYIVTSFGYERSRNSAPPPLTLETE